MARGSAAVEFVGATALEKSLSPLPHLREPLAAGVRRPLCRSVCGRRGSRQGDSEICLNVADGPREVNDRPVGGEEPFVLLSLHHSTAAADDPSLCASGRAEEGGKGAMFFVPERVPAVGSDVLLDGVAKARLQHLVGILEAPAEPGRQLSAECRLAGAAHANDDNNRADCLRRRAWPGHCSGGRLKTVLQAEVALHVLPELGVRLADAVLVVDHNARDDGAEYGKAHGNAVIVVAVDHCAVELASRPAVDLDAVLQLVASNAALAELLHHSGDAIALLHALVGDARDARDRVGAHGSHGRSCHECVCQILHININALQCAARVGRDASDGCGGVCLRDSAAHGAEHAAETSVALERHMAHSLDGYLSARDGTEGEWVGRGRGVSLHSNDRGVLVHTARDGVRQRGVSDRLGHFNAELLHKRDRHVDVGL
mmetsp:Transcript_7872/g.33114  ORF Transcript_7872/g.33114 Transcript_7872/m.33114 type:complete len:430 (+) Transcript_7872:1778-3067(+)